MKKVSSSTTGFPTAGLLLAHAIGCSILFITFRAALKFADVSGALAFYGVYHREPWNQFIHFFGVPGIIWSFMVFLVHLKVPILGNIPFIKKVLPEKHEFTYGVILAIFYLVFYLKIDPFGGVLYAPIVYLEYTSAVYLQQKDQKEAGGKSWSGTGKLLTFAFILHAFSWYIQIHLGHHVIEGAQPASLQSLGGAITVAPLFAYYEFLWLIGVNSELQNETLRLVTKYTNEICDAGKIYMRVCETLSS